MPSRPFHLAWFLSQGYGPKTWRSDYPGSDVARWMPVRQADALFRAFGAKQARLKEAFPNRAAFGQATTADLLKVLQVSEIGRAHV